MSETSESLVEGQPAVPSETPPIPQMAVPAEEQPAGAVETPSAMQAPAANLKTLLESLLFVAEAPVSIEALARALEIQELQVEQVLEELKQDYENRGMRLQRIKDRVQLVSAPESATAIQSFLGLSGSGHLSAASLETLAVIAYRQPVTRPAIEAVRGVNCDAVLHSLLARGLIQEAGRLETAGRPILYETTFDFLQQFGLKSVQDLPALEEAIENALATAVEQAEQTADEIAGRIK